MQKPVRVSAREWMGRVHGLRILDAPSENDPIPITIDDTLDILYYNNRFRA